MLDLEDITRDFRVGPSSLQVLKGISIRLEAGELVSITGGSVSPCRRRVVLRQGLLVREEDVEDEMNAIALERFGVAHGASH